MTGDLGWLGGIPRFENPARCAEADPDQFFPERGERTGAARQICSGCEAQVECLQWAIDHDEHQGIWGGLAERERRRISRGWLAS